MASLRPLLLSSVLLGAGACGSPAAPLDGGGLTGGRDLSGVVSSADMAMAGSCKDDIGDKARGGACIERVTGQVVTEAGAPLPDTTVTVCASACFYGMTDATGHFTVTIGQYIVVSEYSVMAHVNPRRAAYYLALPAANGAVLELPAAIPAPLMPMSGPVIANDKSAQTLHGDGVDLLIADGTVLFFSVEDTSEMPLGAMLRPWRVTDYSKLPFASALAPLALYGFGPFEIDFRTKARAAFANVTGLPAGAAVDVWTMHGLIRGTPPGWKFDIAATAHVSSDGKTVEMDPGTGLDTLTWIALKKH